MAITVSNRGAITERPMVVVLSMAAAAVTSTDMVLPKATQNKHRSPHHRGPASGDGSGTGDTGFAPAYEHKHRDGALGEGQKSECASSEAGGGGRLGSVSPNWVCGSC